ncbi:MAG: tetratricopeptide repeat protein, partial [Bacteroidota bacterium]
IAATLPEQTEIEESPVVEETEAITEVVEPFESSPVEIAATLPEQTEVVESPVVKETEAITEVVEPVESSPVEIAATLPEQTEVEQTPVVEVEEMISEAVETAEEPILEKAEILPEVAEAVEEAEGEDELENLILEELLQVEELDFSEEIGELTEEESQSTSQKSPVLSDEVAVPEETESHLPNEQESVAPVLMTPVGLLAEEEEEDQLENLPESPELLEAPLPETETPQQEEIELVETPLAQVEETHSEIVEPQEVEEVSPIQVPIHTLEEAIVSAEKETILEPVNLIEEAEEEEELETQEPDPLLLPVSLLEMEEEEETNEGDSDSEEEEEPGEEEEAKEFPLAVPTSGTPPVHPPEAAVVRVTSTQVKKSSKPRTLAKVRSRESDGILRKVAYWSQELSQSPAAEKASATTKESPSLQPAETQLSAPAMIPMLEEKYERSSPFAHETIRLKTNAPGEEPAKNYGSFRKVFAMVGMGIMMLAVGSGLIYNYLKADKQAVLSTLSMFEPGSTYNILILPFTPDGDCQSSNSLQESAVRDHLSSLPEIKDLGIQVAFLDGVACPQNSEDAKVTGKLHNAQLVIWGEASRNEFAQEQIYVNYVSLANDTRTNQRVAQGVGQRALEDVYDLQEGDFAGEAQDLVYWVLSIAHLRREDYASAISYIEQITIREEAEYAVLMHMLAKCYQGMGRLDDALTAYGEAIYLNPQNANYYHHRGILHQQMDQRSEALEDYTEAIRLNPQHLKAQYQRNLLLEDDELTNEVPVNQAATAVPVAN